jgi:hypothetical protein
MPSDWVTPDKTLGDIRDWIETQRFVRSVLAKNA